MEKTGTPRRRRPARARQNADLAQVGPPSGDIRLPDGREAIGTPTTRPARGPGGWAMASQLRPEIGLGVVHRGPDHRRDRAHRLRPADRNPASVAPPPAPALPVRVGFAPVHGRVPLSRGDATPLVVGWPPAVQVATAVVPLVRGSASSACPGTGGPRLDDDRLWTKPRADQFGCVVRRCAVSGCPRARIRPEPAADAADSCPRRQAAVRSRRRGCARRPSATTLGPVQEVFMLPAMLALLTRKPPSSSVSSWGCTSSCGWPQKVIAGRHDGSATACLLMVLEGDVACVEHPSRSREVACKPGVHARVYYGCADDHPDWAMGTGHTRRRLRTPTSKCLTSRAISLGARSV
jgi:hypothetical protein